MISSHSLILNAKRGPKSNCMRNFDDYRAEGLIGAQLFGSDPDIMGDAAKILEQNGASWIDVNMGCPVPKVATRAGAGANLMRYHDLAGRIVQSVVSAVTVPVSIKTRLGWDDAHRDTAHLLHVARDSGASWATIHGRTRMAGYAGAADWEKIAETRAQFGDAGFPVVFNGDIRTPDDLGAVAALGADGVMIGRALCGNPGLLGELSGCAGSRPSLSQLVLAHFETSLDYYGEKTAVPMFRKHAAWYANGMENAATFRVCVNQIKTAKELRALVANFFQG
jgi:tRNA-dihydrouridine synthase B